MGNDVSSKSRDFGYVERFVEPCILLLLSKSPLHGYGFMEGLEKHCGEKVDIGNLYRTLRKMEKNRWVKSNWKKGALGPNKRIYQITPKGQTILKEAASHLTKTQLLITHFFVGYKRVFKGR